MQNRIMLFANLDLPRPYKIKMIILLLVHVKFLFRKRQILEDGLIKYLKSYI